MSQYQDLIIPGIEIHEIGRPITPKSEKEISSTEPLVKKTDWIATKAIPEITPLPEPQVVIDLKNFNWSKFDKVNSRVQIKLLHDQLILAFEEIIETKKAQGKVAF